MESRLPYTGYDYVVKESLPTVVASVLAPYFDKPIVGVEAANVELVVSVVKRVTDFLFWVAFEDGERILVHVEVQLSDSPEIPRRMAEYALGCKQKFGVFPMQYLYLIRGGAERYAEGGGWVEEGGRRMLFAVFEAENFSVLGNRVPLDCAEGLALAMFGGGLSHPRIVERIERLKGRISDKGVLQIYLAAQLLNKDGRIDGVQLREILERLNPGFSDMYLQDLVLQDPLFKPLFDSVFDEGKRTGFDEGKRTGFDEGKRTGAFESRRQMLEALVPWLRELGMS
ncbi:MAG: hypothetical protein RMM53_09960, partial [Bacteroidia bacterium]|nr:hypothetical protein [Bacteroidia bacterium]MDW8334527.1 hypothetical protein [Bacteroidia bacterium]